MLFAPSAKAVPLQQAQMTPTKGQHSLLATGNCLPHENKETFKSRTSKEILEAMTKLDAKLVNYLSEHDISPKINYVYKNLEKESSHNLFYNHLNEINNEQSMLRQQLLLLKGINGIKIQMEALTLQAEGTKRMELLQNDIRPIFTVECELSHDLIKDVPRYELFHVMQFESEKFQSLTQCTRFGQELQREIRYSIEEKSYTADDCGQINFMVWWREPGTCLNEMLGMGVLQLKEMICPSLLEKCKCVTIARRGVHLANVYFKINLLQRQRASSIFEEFNFKLCFNTSIKQKQDGIKNANSDEETMKKTNDPQLQNGFQAESGATSMSSGGSSVSCSGSGDKMLRVGSSEFTNETSRVRLLKGFLYANETRDFEMLANCDYFLVCRRFWLEEAGAVTAINNDFNYKEQFSVINDDKFLDCVNMQQLEMEIWRQRHIYNADNNGNSGRRNAEKLGEVRLPLHQFFIAYKDMAITNHLCKTKMPVISVDTWMAISCCHSKQKLGEIKCLLAIGSEEQIINLKKHRALESSPILTADKVLFYKPMSRCGLESKPGKTTAEKPPEMTTCQTFTPPLGRSADLLDMLQNALNNEPAQLPALLTSKTTSNEDVVIDQFEKSLNISHLNLGPAIAQKCIELEHISQRLRSRLTEVTGEPLATSFNISIPDNWEPFNAAEEYDSELEQFEHDINNEAVRPPVSAPSTDEGVLSDSSPLSTNNTLDNHRRCC